MKRKWLKQMANPKKKKRFKVEENESISDCLASMKAEGYTPVRRSEVPVFKEENGKRTASHQQIENEGRRTEDQQPEVTFRIPTMKFTNNQPEDISTVFAVIMEV